MTVITDTFLTRPDSTNTRLVKQSHRLMRHRRTRPQHQRPKRRRRDMNRAALIRRRNRISVTVYTAPLQVDESQPVSRPSQLRKLGRDEPRRRPRQRSKHSQAPTSASHSRTPSQDQHPKPAQT